MHSCSLLLVQEILQMMAKALGARLTQLQLVKGTRSRSRWLVVEHLQVGYRGCKVGGATVGGSDFSGA